MKAVVVYHSKNGVTRNMAQAIGDILKNNNTEVKVGSIDEITYTDINEADRLYMGSWTSGFMLFGQKPAKEWRSFVGKLPISDRKKTLMFATYKVKTGSMFKNMRKVLRYRGFGVMNVAVKSKNGELNEEQKKILLQSLN
jgi:flavodoxin